MSDVLKAMQAGWPMTQASITEAVNSPPNVVAAELFHLVINGDLVRRCGSGSAPAMYCVPSPEAQREVLS